MKTDKLIQTTDVAEILAKLPTHCATTLPSDGNKPIIIKRGVRGYYEAVPDLDVEAFNAARGVTPAQLEAMKCGSMFGWEVPGANPDNWPEKK